MHQATAIHRFAQLDKAKRYIFTIRELEKIFSEDSAASLHAGLDRLVKQEILERVARGVYLYRHSRYRNDSGTLELIARALKRGEYSYVSLESALSEYGLISQIPTDRITLMTTGRKGTFNTPLGVIEFVHTSRAVTDIITHTRQVGRPLRLATPETALRDLRRVGRNTHLIDEKALDENRSN